MPVAAEAWDQDWPTGYPDQDIVDLVYGRLRPEGRAEFLAELDSHSGEDDQRRVIQAWYTTMRLIFHPDRDSAVERAHTRQRERQRPASYEEALAELEAL